jgi:hypothetical protein
MVFHSFCPVYAGKWVTKEQIIQTPVSQRTCLQQVSYDCRDTEGSIVVLIEVGKLKCSGRSSVADREKQHNARRRMGLCCHLHRRVQKKEDMPLRKTGGYSSNAESQDGWCRRHKC